MQLPRVIIAAVFFVIGALIAIPALTNSLSSSRAASAPASSGTVTPTATSTARTTARASAKATATATPTATATARTPSPSKTSTPKITNPIPSQVVPKITITPKPPTPVPLKATVTAVRCPALEVTVTVTNSGIVTEDYTIKQDGQVALADRVAPRGTRSNPLTLKEGKATKIAVTWRNTSIRTATRTATCAAKPPARKQSALPTTGPDSAELYAKIATGVAAMITGVIIFWWGGIWPRRREHMFAGGRKTVREPVKKDSE